MSATGWSSPNFSYDDDEQELPLPRPPPPNEAPFDSDDEEAWDEIDVTADNSAAALAAAQSSAKDISVVISKADKGKKKKKGDGLTTRDRMVRQQRHKAHTTCLLATGLIRNRYLNDAVLQARLVSKVPLHLQNAFRTFSKTTHPNERDRIRLFDRALEDLLSWWYIQFEIIDERGLRRRDVAEVDQELSVWSEVGAEAGSSKFPWEERVQQASDQDNSRRKKSAKKRGKTKERDWGPTEDTWEEVKNVDTLGKHAIAMKGSRDMSAQLFTCLCRALDIPARLVFSLQPVDWRSPSATAKKSSKARKSNGAGTGEDTANTTDSDVISKKGKRDKASAATSGRDSATEGWEDGQGKLGYTKPQVNLRRSKPAPKRSARSLSPGSSELTRPPVFWTEAWSRYSRKWTVIDPSRKKYRCKGIMEPPRSTRENQLLYAVAFEEDLSARDVTPRYTKSYNNYTVKMRAPSKKGTDWFAELLKPFERSFELNRDRDEKEELWKSIANEPFPTSIGGFKNHPNYVLEQHLHRDEVIRPGARKLGVFKATDSVFRRSDVVQLKSTENFWREGRVVKDDEIPMKWVKSRTVTINRKRAEEFALQEGNEPTQQALYSEAQTEIYVPPPVGPDGKIPRNNFGNIDLYVPSMLPAGAIHLASKQAAKVAKARGIEYADAITGFEFRQRRANPIISGIVVAADKADQLLEAIIESEQAAEEKEFAKRQDRCLKRWKKLILGLRIRQRLQASYQDKSAATSEVDSDVQTKSKGKRAAPEVERDVAPPRKRPATKSPTAPTRPKSPPRTRASVAPAPPAAVVDSRRSTSGRSLRLNLSPQKGDVAVPTTRASVAKAAGVSAAPPRPVVVSGTGSDSASDDLEYESDF